ncbi:hypothetical protein D3C73_1377830 [compost metagenome]
MLLSLSTTFVYTDDSIYFPSFAIALYAEFNSVNLTPAENPPKAKLAKFRSLPFNVDNPNFCKK